MGTPTFLGTSVFLYLYFLFRLGVWPFIYPRTSGRAMFVWIYFSRFKDGFYYSSLQSRATHFEPISVLKQNFGHPVI
ncbi:hypothetical protein LEP1GSC076_3201 [Leptospira sp. Fiocruz LV4135]|nr:hypothetical protein LEP1GSC076_3201 [Leptospira sp. Fiocruz LV4135]